MSNKQLALFLESKGGNWVVGETDILEPGPGEIRVKIEAVALNPVEWKVQKYSWAEPWATKFPAIVGLDSTGVVDKLGENVTGLNIGDRVLHEGCWGDRYATYQQYVIVPANLTAKLPANITFEEAASIPVGLVTAAFGLYHSNELEYGGAGLTPSWEVTGKGKYSGKPIIIIGGSSSVGQYVIQLAKLSGFSPIITTASPHNADYLKSLGATHIVDRNAVLSEEVSKITTSPIEIIYDTISSADTQTAAWDVLSPSGQLVLVLFEHHVNTNSLKDKSKTVFTVMGNAQLPNNVEIGKELFGHLTELLENGTIKPNKVEVLPGGLGGIPAGLKKLEVGVSAKKLIVKPQETSS